MRKLILPLLLFVAVVLVSCNTTKKASDDNGFDSASDKAELVDGTWVVETIYGKDVTAPSGRDLPTLTFSADGSVAGHTGCNPIHGTYQLKEGLRISFDKMATGLALCSDIDYERDLNEILNRTDNYTMSDGKLYLNKGRMAPMAVLVKK